MGLLSIAKDRLMTYSLRSAPWGQNAIKIMSSALDAVDPYQAIHRHLKRQGNRLDLNGESFNLAQHRQVYLVGAGKAGAPMARAVVECMGGKVDAGLVIVKDGYLPDDDDLAAAGVEMVEAGHPIPDERGRKGTLRIIKLLAGVKGDDLVICVISGGGSALMHALVEGVSLQDLQRLTSQLLAVGADIREINTLRKHLDKIKGGGLAKAATPAQVITMILSDVIGDPLDVIASGPTVPDRSTFIDAWAVIKRYDLLDQVPSSILEHLQQGVRGEIADTPKQGDDIFQQVTNCIVANNSQAAQAALEAARRIGYQGLLLTTELQGEASRAGQTLGALVRQVKRARDANLLAKPLCLVVGGETTVTIAGDGKGGRNQELALGAVEGLAGLDGVALVTLATDGGDGPTDAAGAVVTGETFQRAENKGLVPADFLSRNDSYHFFEALDDLIKTGPTLTNVNDLTFLFIM
jgi:hydroxypyruvate reductase